MCRGSSLLNGVTPIVPPVRLSPHPRTKLLDGDWPPVVRRPRPSGARPAYRQAPSGRIRFSARGVAARAGEKLLRNSWVHKFACFEVNEAQAESLYAVTEVAERPGAMLGLIGLDSRIGVVDVTS